MTLDDLERPKPHSCRNKIVFRSPPEKFELRQTVYFWATYICIVYTLCDDDAL